MPFTSDSSSDEWLVQDHLPWSQIEAKFRGLIISRDLSKVEIVDFLETFLKFIRIEPKESRSFTRSIFKYLLATKNLISNTFVEQSCCVHIKNILVIYCVLELRLTTCLDDESAVASNIITKIFLLMQRSKSVTILDALIDIDEIIRSSRSKSVMAIVYRHFLTRAPAGPPRVLDDNTFIKHLILYRSWYSAEVMNGKVDVFKRFSSTIKPTEELRTNQSYSLLGIDEVVDYKQLLQQPLPRNALIRALRDAESVTDSQNDDANLLSLDKLLDLTTDDETAMKVEVDLTLNLTNETISVDDEGDNDDSVTISYLPKLFERWDAIDECEWRVAVLQHTRETMVYDGDDESSTDRTAKKVTFGSVTTHVYEVCDDDWCDDDSYTDEFYDDDSSDKSNTDSFTGPLHNFPSATNRTDHSSYQLISESNRDKYSAVANSKPRKKKRSHFGKPIARCSIDDWIRRKKLTTSQCVASGNVCVPGERVKNCRITLKRLADHGQRYGTNSGHTNPQFGKVDFSDDVIESEDWSVGSSTKSSNHTVSKASKSVIRSTETHRVMFTKCPELGLKKCTVRLKRLPSSQLHPTSTSSKRIRKYENVQTTNFTYSRDAYETKTFFESSSPSDCGTDFSSLISSKRVITTNSTDEETLSESTSMESFLDQPEHLICSPDTTTLLTSQSLPSTAINTEIWLYNDKDVHCATNSDRSVTTSLQIEFVDYNDKSSPLYLPSNDKQKNDKRSKSPVNISDIADASKGDSDEISAITNFIGSVSV
ncbi:uncharacterized protein LOC119073463 [Bradysia coprophila]|uniref:uncharacterized protein LOC119073463 n=1 Tax=Bradysia coprophila TaxID=38358 RepID=UPI00187DBBAD|nr:uncharacterized protein LOC119073463 [Bradysia coprophila]